MMIHGIFDQLLEFLGLEFNGRFVILIFLYQLCPRTAFQYLNRLLSHIFIILEGQHGVIQLTFWLHHRSILSKIVILLILNNMLCLIFRVEIISSSSWTKGLHISLVKRQRLNGSFVIIIVCYPNAFYIGIIWERRTGVITQLCRPKAVTSMRKPCILQSCHLIHRRCR